MNVLAPGFVFRLLVVFVLLLKPGLLDQAGNELAGGLVQHVAGQRDQKLRKAAHGGERTAGKPRVFGFHQRVQKRKPMLRRVSGNRLHRGIADAAPRLVDDAPERNVVVRVHQHAQVSDHVLDLLAVIELQPAVHAIANAAPHKRLFQHAALRVRAVQNRHIAQLAAAARKALNGIAHPRRLVPLVQRVIQPDLVARVRVRPQRLLLAAGVVRDHLIGRVQNIAGGTVVLLQLDHRTAAVILFEFQNVSKIRAAPAVNRLVVVAHDAHVLLVARQRSDKHVLELVRILILVHHDIGKLPAVHLQHRRMLGQKLQRLQNQIVEVQRVVFL